MSELAPTAPAAPDDAESSRPRARAGGLRWPAWLPKTVAATAAVTLVTAWIFPALSHQWQDRQKARELTAGLVSEIGKNTSQALVTSSFITFNRFPSSANPSRRGFNQELFNRLDLEWRTSSAEIEAELRAYFPDDVVARWRRYSNLVWGTYRLITDNRSVRAKTLRDLQAALGPQMRPEYVAAMKTPWVDTYTARASEARNAYFFVSSALLRRRSVVIDELLDSHPAGYSTQASDLFHDLVPFL